MSGFSRGVSDMVVSRWEHGVLGSAARASGKLGVALPQYQGREIQVRRSG